MARKSGNVSDTVSVKVSRQAPNRRRVKIGATLDPDLVGAVDSYVAKHPGVDRSAVLDDALRLWQQREQDLAMERQIREDAPYHDDPDRVAWRHLRDAAAARTFTKRR